MVQDKTTLWLGLDVGSTTAKIVVIDPHTQGMLFSRYTRHNARQIETVHALLGEVFSCYPQAVFRLAVCGSGGRTIADLIQAPYIQEVVANSIAVKTFYPQARLAIELGGQDAKIIFFYQDAASGRLVASDMRMNGSCAGGTGAFIDEVAHLLQIPVEDFESFAVKGSYIYEISGRCGVFAKTDIQPLLNQGVRREDIALSAFHAIAKQTIGGLAQGLELKPPIIFEGGPLRFNPTLIRVFEERLGLDAGDIIRPQDPETLVAYGTALSLGDLFADAPATVAPETALSATAAYREYLPDRNKDYFSGEAEKREFQERHKTPPEPLVKPGSPLRVYLGIDAGSTTTKFVLLDEDAQVVDRFYTSNHGDPLKLIRQALMDLDKKYQEHRRPLEIIAVGTTGYGEVLFAKALGADYHSVETVCHAEAALKYVPDASFILDIGGQDMKAITLSQGVITGITLNEACSAGCGSFLENCAKSLDIPVDHIADMAFAARNPADLGSRCTVFMNSCIINEQRNGKQRNDIMAGLCRSIIENVFTKVIRISNFSSLGNRIVVQGGTFKNDAVLRALEQYTGQQVIRAPYPGEMGAIGIALLTKKQVAQTGAGFSSRFIGLSGMEDFSYTQQSNAGCTFCANNCKRTIITFSNGETFVTGNRCERGEITGTPDTAEVREKVRQLTTQMQSVPDLMKTREQLLFKEYPLVPLSPPRNITIGIPRVLEFWNSMPFWTSFWHALGFKTQVSAPSSRSSFEQGLPFVSSDTVCFPAKLTHGHIRDLVDQKVDRIFMPMIIRMPSENTEPLSNYVCAVLKGYPLVIKHSDDPQRRWNTTFDTPIFHWFKPKDRNRQICDFMLNTFGIPPHLSGRAIAAGDRALAAFRTELVAAGDRIIRETEKQGNFAVVLAGRPYHNDTFVNHDLSRYFTRLGIPVLTVDALPGLNDTDLRMTRTEIMNNFHARVLSGAILTARHSALEYVQIVSFGCGHDAVLTDELIRLMNAISGKAPLILKLDESNVVGPLNLRIKSFIETIRSRREQQAAALRNLEDPYPVKFTRQDWHHKTLLIPNVSVAFCKLLSAAIRRQGFKVEPLPLGGREAMKLGKKYVHNDICFPAQMNIGEGLAVLAQGLYKPDEVVIALAKYPGDCRLSHYASLARRALDAAGFSQVPIATTDKLDTKNMYPGFKLGLAFEMRMLWGTVIMDILEELRRKIRPYEVNPGQTEQVFTAGIDAVAEGMRQRGISGALSAYKKGIDALCTIPYNRQVPKPPVFITGEYLLNYHPGSNFFVEDYLEKHNMEVILPRMLDVFHREYVRKLSEMQDFHVSYPFADVLGSYIGSGLFDVAIEHLEKTARRHPLYEPATPIALRAAATDPIMHRTLTSGEGWLIPGEILHHASRGVRSFVILQPFGCLPNHIAGRGVVKRLKEVYPHIQILPLDYDPDTSFANIENRLQMLIMNARS
ncbi:MAG: acyl-CoA dehydratase activase [Treponema sp.]|jgi:predicted CoA-substrate-specific enzyme activase|nr:acyl-CoA dehydratase activase [Treponema sp.]